MPDTDRANRAHLQSYIAASFNPALDKDAINAKVQAAVSKKQAAASAMLWSPATPSRLVRRLHRASPTGRPAPGRASAPAQGWHPS
ncbi:hypothetical protein [Actinacidiphila oryziradicis]|uniref:hypothetical protein n=1 Tax=Actinacidiphila oryziradicis TaxID=2571141 RepID=UPI0023F403F1|nr:hypothetical protein [Actinacidiphila oryziradicis]MCW2869305.1 hypothetical protein [Actinacidiphila oryziradicis]